jgi:hypothetical protein
MKSNTINNKELKILLEQLPGDKLQQLYEEAKSKVRSQKKYKSFKDEYLEIVRKCLIPKVKCNCINCRTRRLRGTSIQN